MAQQHRRKKGAPGVRVYAVVDPAIHKRLSELARERGVSLNLALGSVLRAGLPPVEQAPEVLS
jgi:hypothetical protein